MQNWQPNLLPPLGLERAYRLGGSLERLDSNDNDKGEKSENMGK